MKIENAIEYYYELENFGIPNVLRVWKECYYHKDMDNINIIPFTDYADIEFAINKISTSDIILWEDFCDWFRVGKSYPNSFVLFLDTDNIAKSVIHKNMDFIVGELASLDEYVAEKVINKIKNKLNKGN